MLAEPISTDNGNSNTSLAELAIPSGAMNLSPFSETPHVPYFIKLHGQGLTGDFCHKYAHRELVTVTPSTSLLPRI